MNISAYEYKDGNAGFKFKAVPDQLCTVKPLITNTSEEFIKCRLDNFSMSFMLYIT